MLKLNDKIIFKVNNKELHYEVKETYLSCVNTVGNNNGSIFKELGISTIDAYNLCSYVYGYKTKQGQFPCFNYNDFEAANRIIDELYNLCKEFDNKKLEKGYKVGDKLTFKLNNNDYHATILDTHLKFENFGIPDNAVLFKLLNIDKVRFCRSCYGYEPTEYHYDTNFPQYQPNDLYAINQVIENLKAKCDDFNKTHSSLNLNYHILPFDTDSTIKQYPLEFPLKEKTNNKINKIIIKER